MPALAKTDREGSTNAKGQTSAKALRNLIVATVNTALERGLLTLDCEPFEVEGFEFELAGMTVVGHVRDVGFDEVSVNAIVEPTALGRASVHVALFVKKISRFGAAAASMWLERRDGKYLQTTFSFARQEA